MQRGRLRGATSSVPRHFVVILLALLLGAGCAGGSAGRRAFVDDEVAGGCPLGIRQVDLEVADVPGGVAVTFTSQASRSVDEIRVRVRDSAFRHGPGSHAGLGHDGEHRRDHGHGLKLWDAPPARASVDDVNRGTRLRLIAVNASTEAELRTRIHRRVQEMRSAPCD